MTAPHGDYRLGDLPERIRGKIRADSRTGCWVWTGARNSTKGVPTYGVLRWPDGAGQPEPVHRIAWSLLVGDIPAGHQIGHVPARGCRTLACCNPAHCEAFIMGNTRGLPALTCDHNNGELDAAELDAAEPAVTVDGDVITIRMHIHLHPGGAQ